MDIGSLEGKQPEADYSLGAVPASCLQTGSGNASRRLIENRPWHRV